MTWHLGQLSERYESGGDPGSVSSGLHDAGGVSYGLYQLSSATGAAADFARNEGRKFDLTAQPGSGAFGGQWRAAAKQHGAEFADAQRVYIKRSHYDPCVRAVAKGTGVNLNARGPGVRDAAWSCAVQHGQAAHILIEAVTDVGAKADDATLIRAIYRHRSAYMLKLARKASPAVAAQRRSIVVDRYADELKQALEMT